MIPNTIINLLKLLFIYSVEVIRLGQSLWVNWDVSMYFEPKDTPALARCVCFQCKRYQVVAALPFILNIKFCQSFTKVLKKADSFLSTLADCLFIFLLLLLFVNCQFCNWRYFILSEQRLSPKNLDKFNISSLIRWSPNDFNYLYCCVSCLWEQLSDFF